MRFGMQIGSKRPVFNTDDGLGAAPQPMSQPDPQSERIAALEARLAQFTNLLATQQQTQQQRDAQAQAQSQITQAQSIVQDAETRIANARNKLAQAYESADSALIAAATADLSTATAEATAAKMNLESVKRQLASQPAQPRQQQLDDSNLRNWRDRNKDWYGVDPDMTRAALEIDREVRGEKILEVGSVQYFNAIDARLRAKFPEKFQSSANPSQFQVQRGAPMANNSQQPVARIPAAVADSFRRMGLNVDDPNVVKQLVQARETAVRKGFLPATPVTDRIITR